jgi:hypothetical protein
MKSTEQTHLSGLSEININQHCSNKRDNFVRALDEAMVTGKVEPHDVDTG